jgi:hypothetical protein
VTAALPTHRKWAAWSFLALGVLLPIGWLIAAIANWDDIVESHARLGYLIGDVPFVAPLSLATAYGLLKRRSWAQPVLLLTIGALAYDVIHFCVYLVQEEFLLPPVAWIAIWLLVLGILTWFSLGELRLARGSPSR